MDHEYDRDELIQDLLDEIGDKTHPVVEKEGVFASKRTWMGIITLAVGAGTQAIPHYFPVITPEAAELLMVGVFFVGGMLIYGRTQRNTKA